MPARSSANVFRFALAICLVFLSFRSALAISGTRSSPIGLKLPIMPIMEYDTGTVSVQSTVTGATLPPINTTYYFNQLIDHADPSKGTFQQRYWFSQQFYKQGGPIILFTPGEANAARLFVS
jgi:Serine carboxypeptidase S28